MRKITGIIFATIILTSSNSFASYSGNKQISDPFEGLNRAVYQFNRGVDKVILKPVAIGYDKAVPDLGKQGIRNFLNNLGEPVTLINSALQGDKEQAFSSFWRFTINSTWGIGGIFQVVGDKQLPYRKEDFGQTLGVHGAGSGAYVMLPILGPSNVRDLVGKAVDSASNPFNYAFHPYASATISVVDGIDTRAGLLKVLDDIDRTSLDPYAAIRSLYSQKRMAEILNKAR